MGRLQGRIVKSTLHSNYLTWATASLFISLSKSTLLKRNDLRVVLDVERQVNNFRTRLTARCDAYHGHYHGPFPARIPSAA